MNYKDVNDYEMLYLIGEKDEEAEKILFGKYRNLIIKIAPKYLPFVLPRGGDLDDLVQEGYLGLYSAIQNYTSHNHTLFYTFAYVCIERQMATYCRRLRANKQEVLNYSYSLDVTLEDVRDPFSEVVASNKEDPYQSLVLSDCIQDILDFQNSLSDEMACIFELRMNGFSYKEIAILLDLPKQKVNNSLSKIRLLIKRSHLKERLQIG